MFSLTRYVHKRFAKANGQYGAKIGPHEGQIVELMLNSKKPVACLVFPIDRADIETLLQATNAGLLRAKKIPNIDCDENDNPQHFYYFCQPGQEANMDRLIELFGKGPPEDPTKNIAHHREVASLLGYSDSDVDLFEKWTKSKQLKGLHVYTLLIERPLSLLMPKQQFDYSPIPVEENLDL